MKILYVITRGSMGGAQENVRALAVAAKKSGHEVTVAFGETGWLAAEMNKAGVQTALLRGLRRSWNPLLALVYLRELRSLVRAQQPDIVHFHSSNAMVGLLGIRGHRGPGAQGSSDSRNRNPGTPPHPSSPPSTDLAPCILVGADRKLSGLLTVWACASCYAARIRSSLSASRT